MSEAWRVSEEMVKAVPEPQWTKSWHPVSHAKVITTLQEAVEETGMNIVDKIYTLNGHGSQLFGAWTLDKEDVGIRWMVGFRNSLDKSLALGICAGTHVTACANMVFSGDDFIEFRRHTASLELEQLRMLAGRAVDGLVVKMEDLTGWIKALRERPMSEHQFKILTFEAMKQDVLPARSFGKFLECYAKEQETSPDTSGTLYQFNGAATRLLRDSSLFTINDRTTRLRNFLNEQKQLN